MIYLGENQPSAAYIGGSSVAAMYMGQTQVYPSSSPRVPTGYTELSYLETTGAQYLATTYVPQGDEVFLVDFEVSVMPTGGTSYVQLFGSRTGAYATSPQNCWLGVNSSSKLFHRFGTANPMTDVIISTNTPYSVEVDLPNTTTKVNGTSVAFTGSVVQNCTNPIFIFRMNSGLPQAGQYRISELIIKRGGVIINDFVPAMRDLDNVVGMYDIAGNEGFLTNAGTGTFNYGTL